MPSKDTKSTHSTRSSIKTSLSRSFKRGKKFNGKTWISPSQLRNHILDDPLIDWLSMYKKRKAVGRETTDFLKEKGLQFEHFVIEHIRKLLDINIPSIANSLADVQSEDKFNHTKQLMLAGTPIIYQGVLHNYEDCIYGCPDLIVRSDWINQLVANTLTEDEEKIVAPNLNGQYHYRIIDIKFMTLQLRSDGKTLLNSGNLKYCKSQVIIYHRILSAIQGYTPDECYLLGRGYTYSSSGSKYYGNNCLQKLGVVKPDTSDSSYTNKISMAKDWIKRLRQKGRQWRVLPQPSCQELYPNMCRRDDPYYQYKLKLANKLSDITLIWQCGVKHRQKAFENGVKSWRDSRCTASLLGHNGKIIAPIVDQMLKFNRQEIYPDRVIIPSKIKDNQYNWHTQHAIELYLDIETISNVFDDFSLLPEIGGLNLITMIGVYVVDRKEKIRNYISFYPDQLTPRAENVMIKKFSRWFDKLKKPLIFHWGSCDNRLLEIAYIRNDLQFPNYNWLDMMDIFKKEPILIKGVFGFSLKEVAHGLSEHKLITIEWSDECNNGFQEMIMTWQLYYSNKLSTNSHRKDEIATQLRTLINYNKSDCLAVYKIVNFLRSL